jgi:hypothetical protein
MTCINTAPDQQSRAGLSAIVSLDLSFAVCAEKLKSSILIDGFSVHSVHNGTEQYGISR